MASSVTVSVTVRPWATMPGITTGRKSVGATCQAVPSNCALKATGCTLGPRKPLRVVYIVTWPSNCVVRVIPRLLVEMASLAR
ncbi:MAG: hypothetical protein KGL50_05755 [Burkholderiales bacterium]|nr:hypothetical protein [Burkholderiales bacterium]